MNRLNTLFLKLVRWSGWLLLPLVLVFLLTGYGISGRYGVGTMVSEERALMLHKLFHLPLVVLVLGHVAPATWLAMQRWGWIKTRHSGGEDPAGSEPASTPAR
jgi:hypothetical protein